MFMFHCMYVGLWTRGVTGPHPRHGHFFNPYQVPLWMLTGKLKALIYCEYMAHTYSRKLLNKHTYTLESFTLL